MLKAIQPVESMKNTIIWSKDKASRLVPIFLRCYEAFSEDAETVRPLSLHRSSPAEDRKGKAFYKKMRLRLTFHTWKSEYRWSYQRAKRPSILQ